MFMKKLLIIFLLFSLCACATAKTQFPDIDKVELEAERKRQHEFATQTKIDKKAKKQAKRLEHKQRLLKVSTEIMRGGTKLCQNFEKTSQACLYDFVLTKGTERNAYADGKKIYITPPMMNFAKTDEELAIVLGHEYAHNIMGHISSTTRNIVLGSIVGMVLDGIAATQGVNTGSTFGNLGINMGQLSYSKTFEKEADYVGLYVTSLSGYSIDNAQDFWRRMSVSNIASIYEGTTHPSTPERYIALRKTITEIKSKKQSGETLAPNFLEKKDE